MKVVISGGGTGGHVFPSLAIAEEITSRDPSNEVLFMGVAGGLESRLVPSGGYRFEAVGGGAVSGGGVYRAVSGAFFSVLGVVRAVSVIRKFSPDAAVGTGGYASFPAIAAARIMGVPAVICEQNSVSGLANRALARISQRIFLSFPEFRPAFPSRKTRVVGNPVRRAVAESALVAGFPSRFPLSGACTVFVLGGSRGAGSLNRVLPAAVSKFKQQTGQKIRVIHQTGPEQTERVAALYRSSGIEAQVFDFNPGVERFYAEADLVISRAGAGAISEIALFSKPSILVPYPFAAGGHQSANARMMESAGASVVIEEEKLCEKAVVKTLRRLLNWNRLCDMSRAASAFAAPGAAREIVDEIETLAGK